MCWFLKIGMVYGEGQICGHYGLWGGYGYLIKIFVF